MSYKRKAVLKCIKEYFLPLLFLLRYHTLSVLLSQKKEFVHFLTNLKRKKKAGTFPSRDLKSLFDTWIREESEPFVCCSKTMRRVSWLKLVYLTWSCKVPNVTQVENVVYGWSDICGYTRFLYEKQLPRSQVNTICFEPPQLSGRMWIKARIVQFTAWLVQMSLSTWQNFAR